jgi:hypothetical protein
MTWMASTTLFAGLVFLAIAGVTIGAVTLLVLMVRDWRGGRLW